MADIELGKLYFEVVTDDEAFGLELRKKNESTRELTDRHFDSRGSQPDSQLPVFQLGSRGSIPK